MATVQEVAAAIASFADDFKADVPALTAVGAAARAKTEPDRVVVVAPNGSGKSTILDLLIQQLVSDRSIGEGVVENGEAPAAEDQPLAALLAKQIDHDETKQQAIASGRFKYLTNPDSTQNTNHLANALNSWRGYYCGNDQRQGMCSALLPVGSLDGTTTQVEISVSYDEVVACHIQPRTLSELNDMAKEALESLIGLVLDETTSFQQLPGVQDFQDAAEVFEMLTQHDVKAMYWDPPCTKEGFLAELQRLKTRGDEPEALLLHADLATVARSLSSVLFVGSGHNTSSDLHCVKVMLEEPVECLLRNNSIQLPAGIDITALAGAIIDHIDTTVPCEQLGALTLVDVPGLDDTNPFAYLVISKALSTAQHVLAVVARNLTSEKALLRYLKNSLRARQLAIQGGNGRLIVLHYLEKASGCALCLNKVWSNSYRAVAQKNEDKSKRSLQRMLDEMKSAEDRQRFMQFMDDRTDFITVLLATFCSLNSAGAGEVRAKLENAKATNLNNLDDPEIAKQLLDRTGAPAFLELLAKLSRPHDLQRAGKIKTEMERALAVLDKGTTLTDDEAKNFVVDLKKLSVPATISDVVAHMRLEQGARRAGPNAADPARNGNEIVSRMRVCLQGFVTSLLEEYSTVKLTDGCIQELAEALIADLSNADSKPTMCRLRRAMTNLKLRAYRLRDVIGELVTKLNVSNCQALQDDALVEDLMLRCHKTAAAELADLCKRTIRDTATTQDRRDLLAFMENGHAWNVQLPARIEEELVGMAELGLRGGDLVKNSLTEKLSEVLRECLRRHLKPASKSNPILRHIEELYRVMQNAVVAALKEFRAELPNLLPRLVDEYVTDLVRQPLFMEVRHKKHRIARTAMQLAGAPAPDAGAADTRHGPCLWRCIYNFYQSVISSAAPLQLGARRAAIAQLRQLIQQLNEVAPGPAALADPQQDSINMEPPAARATTALVHRATQRSKLLQVLPGTLTRRFPLWVRTDEDGPNGRTENIDYFLANSGNLDFPAWWTHAPADDEQAVQQLFDRAAHFSLYIKPDCIPPLAPDNAIIAIQAGATGVLSIGADWKGALLRDVIAAETQRNPLDDRAFDPQDIARWAGLLELTYLARALQRSFIVLTAQPSSTRSRNQAFIVPHEKRAGGVDHKTEEQMHALAMILRKDRGITRAWFMPLFLDKQRPKTVKYRRARAGGAGSSASKALLSGVEEQAIRALAWLADEAALTRLSAEDRAVGDSACKRPRVSE